MTREEAKEIVSRHHWSFASMDYEVIEAVECLAEECEDAISRQAVLDIVDSYSGSRSNVEDVTQDIISDIMALPTVTPKQKMGRWIFDDECREHGHCSSCGYGSVDLVDGEPHDFCRRCGARMVWPQESKENENIN